MVGNTRELHAHWQEADEIAVLHAEVARLRKEVHQLTVERNTLRQSFASAAGASPQETGNAPALYTLAP
jgi:hypothetical protein